MIEKYSEFRVKELKGFTVMTKYHLADKTLSMKAKGLLSMMLSMSDGWDFTMRGLVSLSSDGESAVKSTLKELKEHGYVVVTKYKDKSTGRFKYCYDVYRKPVENEQNPESENPEVENPPMGNPPMENHPLYKVNNISSINDKTDNIFNTNTCSPNGELNVSPKGELNAKQLRSNCMEPHQKSNWSITRNHIISLSNKMGYEGDQVSDCLMVVKYFYSQYERFLGKEHPNLNDTTMRKVLTAFYNPEVDCKYVTDTDFTVYEALIDNYFESDMPGVDKSIVHFMSGGVRDIRYIKATM